MVLMRLDYSSCRCAKVSAGWHQVVNRVSCAVQCMHSPASAQPGEGAPPAPTRGALRALLALTDVGRQKGCGGW